MLGRERAVRQFQKITSSINPTSKVPPPEIWIRAFSMEFYREVSE